MAGICSYTPGIIEPVAYKIGFTTICITLQTLGVLLAEYRLRWHAPHSVTDDEELADFLRFLQDIRPDVIQVIFDRSLPNLLY